MPDGSDEGHLFRIDVPQRDLDDLRDRLRCARWAPQHPDTGWDRGVPAGDLRALAEYWADGYDWRAHEARLNDVAQLRSVIDGQPIHVLQARSSDPAATRC